MTRVTRYKPIRDYRRINKPVICRTPKLTEMQIEARRRFHIQLKANYSRIRKNVIIKNIDYWRERAARRAIEQGGLVHLFIR